MKKRVIAYFDGSNFYHYIKGSYGITRIDFVTITEAMLNKQCEKLIMIKYFNSPINQQDSPKAYSGQQKFFAQLKKNNLIELHLGNLARRPMGKMNINCPNCNHQKCESLVCPKCKKILKISECFRYTEKGVDVKLATQLVLDAFDDAYDTALLFSSDADFCPAIRHVTTILGKEVIYCHFPKPETGELVQICSHRRRITLEIAKKAQLANK